MSEKNPHAVALGALGAKRGGESRSLRKQAASRLNGRLGGRPRLASVHYQVYLHGKCIGVAEFPPGTTLAQAKEQLLTENGLDPRIVVRPQLRGTTP